MRSVTRILIELLSGTALAVFSCAVPLQCLAQASASLLPAADNHLYVANESMPWAPSDEQRRTLMQAAADYFAALDAGQYPAAHALLSDAEKNKRSLEAFSAEGQRFNVAAGPLVARRVVRVTWSKNPASAGAPGIYGAIDLVSAFGNIDRRCGYVVFFQSADGAPFRLSGELETQLDNETARTLTENQSYAYLNSTWSKFAQASCPNYPGFNSSLLPAAESHVDPREFKTVSEAYAALSKHPGIEASTRPDGWLVLADETTFTVWGFAPKTHYAYPAMWRRHAVQNEKGGVSIAMSISCEADKAACDRLLRELQSENEQQADHMRAQQQGSGAPP